MLELKFGFFKRLPELNEIRLGGFWSERANPFPRFRPGGRWYFERIGLALRPRMSQRVGLRFLSAVIPVPLLWPDWLFLLGSMRPRHLDVHSSDDWLLLAQSVGLVGFPPDALRPLLMPDYWIGTAFVVHRALVFTDLGFQYQNLGIG